LRIQRSRVSDIVGFASERSRLLTEVTAIEDRERRRLSDALHDGALQYVLAARMDLEDVRDGDGVAVDRVEQALTESATLLRATVGALHPAVLDQAGLVRAVEDLAASARSRGLGVEVRSSGILARPATDAERVVYAAVRELLANVVKHAHATSVTVELSLEHGLLTATVTDDGAGMDPGTLEQRLAEGHIGLTSHRLRIEASGGRFLLSAVQPHGTRVVVVVPASGEGEP
jgi:two-component system, NarL family, sensor kinase